MLHPHCFFFCLQALSCVLLSPDCHRCSGTRFALQAFPAAVEGGACRLAFAMVLQTHSWDVVACLRRLGRLQDGLWLKQALGRLDEMLHGQGHSSRPYYGLMLNRSKVSRGQ